MKATAETKTPPPCRGPPDPMGLRPNCPALAGPSLAVAHWLRIQLRQWACRIARVSGSWRGEDPNSRVGAHRPLVVSAVAALPLRVNGAIAPTPRACLRQMPALGHNSAIRPIAPCLWHRLRRPRSCPSAGSGTTSGWSPDLQALTRPAGVTARAHARKRPCVAPLRVGARSRGEVGAYARSGYLRFSQGGAHAVVSLDGICHLVAWQ